MPVMWSISRLCAERRWRDEITVNGIWCWRAGCTKRSLTVSWSLSAERSWSLGHISKFFHLCEQPFRPIGPSGQRSHFSPVTPSLQLQRPLLSHVALTEPGQKESRCPTLVIKQDSLPEQRVCLQERYLLWSLTCGVAAAGCAALSRPLQVEAVLAALAAAALCVSLTVNAVQTPGVPKAVPRPPIAVATQHRCRNKRVNLVYFGLCV